MKSTSLIAAYVLAGITSQAGIIYQQLPNAGASGYVSPSTTPDGSNSEEFVWDSFSSATTKTVREIQWRGARTNAPVDFQISINTTAIPGGTVWTTGSGGNGAHVAQVPASTGNYRFINAAGDVALTLLDQATVPVTITLARSPAAGGTVTGGGTFVAGADVTINATAANGRAFLNWTEAGVFFRLAKP